VIFGIKRDYSGEKNYLQVISEIMEGVVGDFQKRAFGLYWL
jgi:hypothetical protein